MSIIYKYLVSKLPCIYMHGFTRTYALQNQIIMNSIVAIRIRSYIANTYSYVHSEALEDMNLQN